jgi:hypothetical protein
MHKSGSWAAVCLGVLLLFGCAQERTEQSWQGAEIPPLAPGMARVWVLRMPSQAGVVTGADPLVYANGQPLAKSTLNTVYYHDFAPGSYRFTVQAYGTPANLVDTLQLAPGMTAYVQVQAVPNWQMGSNVGGASFAVLTMSQQEALPYFKTMRYLGEL